VTLRDLRLRKAYSSDSDDVLQDFYIPALGESCEYCRLAGFFSSTSLAIAARGIMGLIDNGGTVKLIACPKLEKRDVEAILSSQADRDKYLERRLLEELDRLEDEFARDHVFALGWMLANQRLEMRVALAYGEAGGLLSCEGIQASGLFHQKVGVLRDAEGNAIAFSGSINETAAAWLRNIEEFKVFRSWSPAERDYVAADVSKFDRFWSGEADRVSVIPVPRAVEMRLVEIAPERLDKRVYLGHYRGLRRRSITLYAHQRDAIAAWLERGRRGILEMATGTGKTFTALGCHERVCRGAPGQVTVIACPKRHLVQQWRRELQGFGLKRDALVVADSSNPRWRDQLADCLMDVSLGYLKKVAVVVTTHATFSSADFRGIVAANKGRSRMLLIADEVHGLGAVERRKSLVDDYEMRLGLSATPRRWFDDAGTEALYDYFTGVAYEFTLEDAINTVNLRTGETFLTPYRYLPRFAALSDEELARYVTMTRRLAAAWSRSRDEEESRELVDVLLFKRADVVKNAEAKYRVLEDLLDTMDTVQWTIVYCHPYQIERVMDILNERRIVAHRFTMEEGTVPEDRYGGATQREYLLDRFAEGRYQVLVAMRCLDEGVDVPPARRAILMASSGNPREYIQRIGRVIRRHPGKTEASIHDVVVTPSLELLPPELRRVEQRVFEAELGRYEEIARIAVNNAESLERVYNMRRQLREVGG
jgi:superfamily II DNA or RNA helicase